MAPLRKYDPAKLEVGLLNQRPASWTFAGAPVPGDEYVYSVADHNSERPFRWEFLVRVPRAKDGRTEVRPHVVPNLKAWAGLERRSLTFSRTNKKPHLGQFYCQIALADPTGARTKDVVHKGERDSLPRWFDALGKRIKLKETVRRTAGSDGHTLVGLVDGGDHAQMIAFFFALKVWILREAVVLE